MGTAKPTETEDRASAPAEAELQEQWQRCERRVTRAWNAWQSAERSEDRVCYVALMAALGEDEPRSSSKPDRDAPISSG